MSYEEMRSYFVYAEFQIVVMSSKASPINYSEQETFLLAELGRDSTGLESKDSYSKTTLAKGQSHEMKF